MTPPILEVRDLEVRLFSRRGTVRAVDGVSFAVSPGTAHGIVGESGCGKTTLLRAVLGLLPPNSEVSDGEVRIAGETILSPDLAPTQAAPGVSIVFQEPMTALNPVMTVGRQISEAPRINGGLSRDASRQRTYELMRQVGIPAPEKRFDAYPHQLSGGLRQRVLIAMALSSEPKVILCDEPTTALDVTIQDQILRLLRRIADESGVAIVYVSHDLAVVARMCQSLSVMYAGRFVEAGSASDVFDVPSHPYTRGLLEAIPTMDGPRQRLKAIPGAPPALIDLPPGCSFAPRCSYAIDICRGEDIPLAPVGGGHEAACVRHSDLPPVATAGGHGSG